MTPRSKKIANPILLALTVGLMLPFSCALMAQSDSKFGPPTFDTLRQPSTPLELLNSAIDTIHDADEKIYKLEQAVDDVKQGETPHFDTPLGELAEQYKSAAMAIEKLPAFAYPSNILASGIPRLSGLNPQAEEQLGNDAESLDYQLRASLERAESTEGALDSEIESAGRKVEVANRLQSRLENFLLPGTGIGNKAVPYWGDADDLARAIANYKMALDNRRTSTRAAIANLKEQIDDVESLTSLIRRDVWTKFLQQLQRNAQLQQENRDYQMHQEEMTRTFDPEDLDGPDAVDIPMVRTEAQEATDARVGGKTQEKEGKQLDSGGGCNGCANQSSSQSSSAGEGGKETHQTELKAGGPGMQQANGPGNGVPVHDSTHGPQVPDKD